MVELSVSGYFFEHLDNHIELQIVAVFLKECNISDLVFGVVFVPRVGNVVLEFGVPDYTSCDILIAKLQQLKHILRDAFHA